MATIYADPFDTLFNLQRALDARIASDWLQDQTAAQGPFPPINVFQQGDNILAIVELPGVDKKDLQIQAKEMRSDCRARKLPASQTAPVRTGANASSVSLTARCRFQFKSTPMESRPSITTGCSLSSCPALNGTNPGP
jgi:hypothetical protein